MMNYHNKKFKAIQNSENGESSEQTIFHYKQDGNLLTATYSGGSIIFGQLLGIVAENGALDFRYHHLNDKGKLLTGICHSTPRILPNGKIQLHEQWKWTAGDLSTGSSVIEEI